MPLRTGKGHPPSAFTASVDTSKVENNAQNPDSTSIYISTPAPQARAMALAHPQRRCHMVASAWSDQDN